MERTLLQSEVGVNLVIDFKKKILTKRSRPDGSLNIRFGNHDLRMRHPGGKKII